MAGSRPSKDQVVGTLKRDGIARLESFFDLGAVETMRDEALELLDGRQKVGIKSKALKNGGSPALAEALSQNYFKAISRAYNRTGKFFVDARITHHWKPTRTAVTDIHFDMARSLKFMIYLSDVDKSCAAFRYCVGSHRKNTAFRSRYLLMGGSPKEIPNVAGPGESFDLTDMEGPRGTLLIFDTDGFHTGGRLQPGKERLLIRSRTVLGGWYDNAVLREMAQKNPLRSLAARMAPEGRGATAGRARAQ